MAPNMLFVVRPCAASPSGHRPSGHAFAAAGADKSPILGRASPAAALSPSIYLRLEEASGLSSAPGCTCTLVRNDRLQFLVPGAGCANHAITRLMILPARILSCLKASHRTIVP